MKKCLMTLLLPVSLLFISCATTETGTLPVPEPVPEGSSALFARLQEINEKAPSLCSIKFTAESTVGSKKNTFAGTVSFDRQAGLFSLEIQDPVFRILMTAVILEAQDVTVWIPGRNIRYIDSPATMNLKNYGLIDMDFRIIYDLLTGRLPVPEKGNITGTEEESVLAVENDSCMEKISFSGNLPESCAITKKSDGTAVLIRLEKPELFGESLLYKKITAENGDGSMKLEIKTGSVKTAAPLKVKTVRDYKIPSGVKTFVM